MRRNLLSPVLFPLFVMLLLLTWACKHHYSGDTLDLGFYQWNMWPDKEEGSEPGNRIRQEILSGGTGVAGHMPSCGWEELHRGIGKLVRIPAVPADHFHEEELSAVTWFHCRYTLPELWKERAIGITFEGISHPAEVYLNGQPVGTGGVGGSGFTIDVTGRIFYTRDNHLSVRVQDSVGRSGGITGKVLVTSSQPAITED
jgi:hypothetical protein